MVKGDLASRLAAGPYWQLVRPVMAGGEQPVHFAHLRCVQGAQDFVGTLFVTSRQVIWRTIDPRLPEGSAFEIPLTELKAVERPQRVAMFRAFRLVVEEEGRPVDVYFFPQHKTEVDRVLADQMLAAIQGCWTDTVAFEGSATA